MSLVIFCGLLAYLFLFEKWFIFAVMTPEEKVESLLSELKSGPLSAERFKLMKLLVRIYGIDVPDLTPIIEKSVRAAIDDDENPDKRMHIEQLLEISGKAGLKPSQTTFVIPYKLLDNQDDTGFDARNVEENLEF